MSISPDSRVDRRAARTPLDGCDALREALERVLRREVLDRAAYAAFFASAVTRGEPLVGLSKGDPAKALGVLRDAGVEWDLRARAACSIARHRRPWEAVRAAVQSGAPFSFAGQGPKLREVHAALLPLSG